MNRQIAGDVSHLPTSAWGTQSLWFYAVVGFMAIEGMGFVLGCGAYLYLMTAGPHWPPDGQPPPDLTWGTALTALMVLSLVPNAWLARAASRRRLGRTRWLLALMVLVAIAALVIRAMEFSHLNARWDHDAYGSVVWALMLLHTTHLVTDFIDTILLLVFLFTHSVDDERFSDVDDNCVYWAFVVAAWLPIYALVYWAPRLAP